MEGITIEETRKRVRLVEVVGMQVVVHQSIAVSLEDYLHATLLFLIRSEQVWILIIVLGVFRRILR